MVDNIVAVDSGCGDTDHHNDGDTGDGDVVTIMMPILLLLVGIVHHYWRCFCGSAFFDVGQRRC